MGKRLDLHFKIKKKSNPLFKYDFFINQMCEWFNFIGLNTLMC